jgi:hypothetical protein
MENNLSRWSQATKMIYQGVLLYSLSSVLYSLFSMINGWVSGAASLMEFATSGTVSAGIGFLDVIEWIFLLAIIVGYFLFFKGLTDFRPQLQQADGAAIGRVRLGVLLGIIGSVVSFIPVIGFLGGILSLIGFIMMLIGYNALKGSATFPVKARSGASTLFIAMILSLVGGILAFIPLIGGVIAFIMNVVVFFMVLSGWAAIKNSTPDAA